MLSIPSYGVHRSVTTHNINISVFCDWLEGCVLFQEDRDLSGSDVIDHLVETQIYSTQNLAWELLADAWRELRRRQNLLGAGYPVAVGERRLTRIREWRGTPAYAFCLILAFAKWYPSWARQFGKDHTAQGELFESLAKESLQKLFSGWVVHATGWRRSQTKKLANVVSEVAKLLSEGAGERLRWTKPSANDAGLDLLLFRPFPDNRVGVPVYLTQCASGGDWEGKLHTPSLRIWGKLIQFASDPKKAFVTPFSWDDDEFRRNCNLVDGMVIDRYRLLSPGREEPDWILDDLRGSLIAWLEARVQRLPFT